MAATSSTGVVLADIGGGLGVAVVKFVVALLTGSSAMLAEAVHSAVDTGNGLVLAFGVALRGRR